MGSISRIRIMSRYPSAYGHTPGYKSMTASTPTFPSALDRGMDLSLSSGLGGRTSSSLMDTSLSSLNLLNHLTSLRATAPAQPRVHLMGDDLTTLLLLTPLTRAQEPEPLESLTPVIVTLLALLTLTGHTGTTSLPSPTTSS